MNKKYLIAFIAAIFIFSLCACNSTGDMDGDGNKNFYTFVDSTGETVEVSHKPERVAVLFPSYADIWQISGGTVSITVSGAVDMGYVDEKDVSIVGDSSGKNINSELLLAAEPDFVILTTDLSAQTEVAELLKENNIPTALFTVDSFDDYLYVLVICTDILENKVAFEENGTLIQEDINELLADIKDVETDYSILLIRAFSTGAKAKTDDNFVGEMLMELGTENIAMNSKVLLDELSLEVILKEDPDFIFVTTMGTDEQAAIDYMDTMIKENKAWNQLSAIKNGNYHILPKNLFHYKPNNRWYEAHKYLADIIYPDLQK